MSAVSVPPRTTRVPRTRRSWARVAVAGLTALAAAAAVLAAGPAAVPPAAAAAGRVYDIGPGSNADARLEKAMAALRPGDTLRIHPGTYGVDLRPDLRLARGTPTRPIIVTASDPANKPLLLGAVKLDQPDYWILTKLRIQGTISRKDSLTINSGTGWKATELEVTGASSTGAYSNVNIARYTGWPIPRKWVFAYNCVHDGGKSPVERSGQLHEVYVTAVGDTQNALIARNLFFNTPYGAAVKLGDGGLKDAPGPDNVQVANNTMYNNGIQVLLFARTTGHKIEGNLFVKSTRTLTNGRDTVGAYMLNLTRGATGTFPNLLKQNYYAGATYPIFTNASSSGSFQDGGDNNRYPAGTGFENGGCAGLVPTDAHAKLYGRWATRSLYVNP